MRTLPALLCAAALALTASCTSDDEPEQRERSEGPGAVTFTGEERDDFLARVEDLGFTCRDALPETDRYGACTRPGTYLEAAADTVLVASTPDGAAVTRVSYCGPEDQVVTAVSDAFLGEVGSPDLLAEIPTLEGAQLQACDPATGTGIAYGQSMPVLRELELDLLTRELTRKGWTCSEDSLVRCLPPGGEQEALVRGTPSQVWVTAPTGERLAEAVQVLGLSPVVAEAAGACAPLTVCDHLLVDGFDMFLSANREESRLRIKVRGPF